MNKKKRMVPGGRNEDSTRQRILAAAIELIGREGMQKVTMRRIASLAKVNVAAMNYHFRSKDALIQEALKKFFSSMQSIFLLAGDDGKITAEDKLKRFLVGYTDLLYQYPGIFISQMAYFIDSILPRQFRPELEGGATSTRLIKEIMSGGILHLRALVAEFTGIRDKNVLNMRIVQTMTSILHPILMTSLPEEVVGFNYGDRESRLRYISLVIRGLKIGQDPE